MTDMTVANTIREQLGGRALMMLGAKNLMGDEKSLQFKIGSNPKGVTHIRITLQVTDLYQVEFLRVRGTKVTTLCTADDVDAENLRNVIEGATGLVTSLGIVTYGTTRLA